MRVVQMLKGTLRIYADLYYGGGQCCSNETHDGSETSFFEVYPQLI